MAIDSSARNFSARAPMVSGQWSGARAKIRVALVPPKPNEFDNATRTSRSRASMGHEIEIAALGRPIQIRVGGTI